MIHSLSHSPALSSAVWKAVEKVFLVGSSEAFRLHTLMNTHGSLALFKTIVSGC